MVPEDPEEQETCACCGTTPCSKAVPCHNERPCAACGICGNCCRCPSAPPQPSPEGAASVFDPLFSQAAGGVAEPAVTEVADPAGPAEPPAAQDTASQEPAEEDGCPVLLSDQVDRIVNAIDRLSRKGLNLKGVVALLHDANPSISKKSVRLVFEALLRLPELYARDPKSKDILRRR